MPHEHSALVAVGGYGRGELFPCSDVDLLDLVRHAKSVEAQIQPIEELIGTLWDIGLRSGSQRAHPR